SGLSPWSDDAARRDAISAGSLGSVPVLVVGNSADDACTPSHTTRLFDSVAHDRKHLHVVQGATHYYTGPDSRAHMAEAIDVIGGFLRDHR
ncbi:MAG: alpha/beta hydrolase, partial [Actinomycetota bacterium]|nr:alpha/beta hydrolase [Actinomycetota bacterium]